MRRTTVARYLIVAVAVAAAGITSRAFGQQNDPNARPGQPTSGPADPRAGGDRGQESHIDQMVANQLLEMSKGEVELANFALQHTQNDQVKQFAQQMIEDHTNFNNQLAKFASPELSQNQKGAGNLPQPGNTPGGAAPRTAQPGNPPQPGATAAQPGQPPNPNERNPANPGERGNETAAGGDKAVQLCEDIGQQIGSGITKELNQYQGSDFDRAYTGQQFWDHVIFIGLAKGAEKHVSPDLQQVISQGASTAEKHLEHCRKLIRDLSSSVARGNETTPRR
jgi:predicted outer membrane protein